MKVRLIHLRLVYLGLPFLVPLALSACETTPEKDPPNPFEEVTNTERGLPEKIVTAAVTKNMKGLCACEVRATPGSLTTNIRDIAFSIAYGGKPNDVAIRGETLAPELVACLTKGIEGWRFPVGQMHRRTPAAFKFVPARDCQLQ